MSLITQAKTGKTLKFIEHLADAGMPIELMDAIEADPGLAEWWIQQGVERISSHPPRFALFNTSLPDGQTVESVRVQGARESIIHEALRVRLARIEEMGLKIWKNFNLDDTNPAHLSLHTSCKGAWEDRVGNYDETINLVSLWDGKESRTQATAFDRASESGVQVVDFQTLDFCLANPELLRQQNGTDLPFCETGVIYQPPSEVPQALCFGWESISQRLFVSFDHLDEDDHGWSLGSVVES